MDRDFIAKHWYASVYEQFENETHDVEFLLDALLENAGGAKLNILEVACGGGRICVPLAKAGHTVTGFDADEFMLLRCYRRMKGLPNLRCYRADALETDWGAGYDAVVLAGNLLINIESALDYEAAQKRFIGKAAAALRPGGHLYLDFDLHSDPKAVFHGLRESSYFCGADELGTSGKTVSYGGVYDPATQICAGAGHWELMANNGETLILSRVWHKHIPTQAQVYRWLRAAGFTIERTYRNFTGEPLAEPIDEGTYRATIWARRD